MNIIISGVGKVGGTLVETLIKENHNIVVIDKDAKTVEHIINKYDVNGIVGNGSERDILIDAGIAKADFFIASTSHDEANILCCVLAKTFGAKYTIARVRDPEYFKEEDTIKEYLGIDMLFNPEYRTAIEIARVLKFPSAKNVETFAGGLANMVEFTITENNPLINKSLIEINNEYKSKVLFAIVHRDEKLIIPHGDFIIQENDTVLVIAPENEISAFFKKLHTFKMRAKSVFIIGGGKVAFYLARELLKSGISVKILENNEERCRELSENLSGATIILADGTDKEILEEEKLKNADACVTLTGMDEENVIISLYAILSKVKKVVTKIDRPSVSEMVKMLGLDTVVSPRYVIANHVLRFVRAHQGEASADINTLYKIYNEAEAIEFSVDEDFSKVNVPLKDLSIKRDILVGGIIRGNEFILPSGSSEIKVGDKVIIVATEKQITELNEILR